MRLLLSTAGLMTALMLSAQPAMAKPTEAQLDAIKSNCRSDFMSNCWGVPRGGAEAFQCLKEHMASLSPGCQKAIKAATPAPAKEPAAPKPEPAPAPAAAEPPAPEPPQQEAAPAQESVPATEPKTKSASPAPQESAPASKPAAAPPALKQAAPEAAPPAKAAGTEASAEPEASATAPSAVPEATPPIIGFIPPRKKLMVQRHCRQELERYCADVDVGQGRVLRCLFSHKSALTADCQGALAKLTN